MHSDDFCNKVLLVLIVGLWKSYSWVWSETHLDVSLTEVADSFAPWNVIPAARPNRQYDFVF